MIPPIVQESTEDARRGSLNLSFVDSTSSDCADHQYTVVQKMHSISSFTPVVQCGDRLQSVSASCSGKSQGYLQTYAAPDRCRRYSAHRVDSIQSGTSFDATVG